MFLFRALNNLDDIVNPVNNGIAAKTFIYDATEKYLLANEKDKINRLNKKDKDIYVKEYMITYLKDHKHKLNKIFERKHLPVKNTIYSFINQKDNLSYFKLMKDLSTLPNHLINGSKTYTNWISCSSNIDKIWKYYDEQKHHKVALINLYSNGAYDDNTYVVDVSNKEVINNIKFLINKINDDDYNYFLKFLDEYPEYNEMAVNLFHQLLMKPTKKNFMGFSFSSFSNEYSVYEYINKESVMAVLESLHLDLIRADLFNENYLLLNHQEQAKEFEKLKLLMLRYILKENDSYMLYVFEQLYQNNNNIKYISNCSFDQERIEHMRQLILTKSQNLSSMLIKRRY